jgi:outer membrane protein assembly factor BamB
MIGAWGCAGVLACCGACAAQTWTHFARGPDRTGVASGPAPDLAARWLAYHDPSGQAIAFVGQSGVVVEGARVYALGKSGGVDRLYAIRRDDGEVVWGAPVDPPYLGSWSTPAIDQGNGAVIGASGSAIRAFDRLTGAPRWQTPLPRPVVNASPLVTGEMGNRDRVFITDYDGFGASGRLHCINADPFDAALNPWQPGEIVWSVVLGGTSGNTPAWRAGVVYVASASDESGLSGGMIRAFDAGATGPPPPLWEFENPAGSGFFGGVCVHAEGTGVFVYGASYAFSGGQTAGRLVKVDALDGSLVWAVPCNRTSATPIPLGDGRIVLSGGTLGFGSMPSVELFADDGLLLWDTALETWQDVNSNGVMEVGEFLLVGGWTHQPAAVVTGGGVLFFAGAAPTGAWSGACTDLYALDLSREPAEPGFVAGHVIAAGSSPGLAGANLYTIGAGGVAAFGAAICYPDCTGESALTVADFGCFQTRFVAGDPYADCSGDAALTVADFGCFQTKFVAGCQ